MNIPRSPILLSLCAALAACEHDVNTAPDAAFGAHDAGAAVANSWSTKSSILSYRRFAAAGVLNNVIYFVGGRDAASKSTKTVYAYTISNNSWSVKADLPKNRSGANGATAIGSRLYVSGGLSNTGGASKTLYAYNFNNNTWVQLKSMPTESACGAQARSAGGCTCMHRPAARAARSTVSIATTPTPTSGSLCPRRPACTCPRLPG